MAVNGINTQKTLQEIIDKTSDTTKDRNTGQLGKDDFLNLLVTQLKYQDPLKPVDDKEFIGQMAQFSSLEQMQNMNGSLSQSQGFSLIGKHVVANITDPKTKEVKTVEGDVSSVKVSAGKVYAVVKGQDVLIDKITDVTEGSRSSMDSNIAQYTNLIGYDVKGFVYDSQTSDLVGVNGIVKSIAKGVYEDYAVMDGVSVQISEVLTSTPSTDPDFMKNYLESHKPKEGVSVDNQISVVITDSRTGKKVPVTAKLVDYKITSDKVTAVLDGLEVPVESVAVIQAAKQSETQNSTQNNTQTSGT